MTKKVILSNLSSDTARKKRSLEAVKTAKLKGVKKDYYKDKKKKLDAWKGWFS